MQAETSCILASWKYLYYTGTFYDLDWEWSARGGIDPLLEIGR